MTANNVWPGKPGVPLNPEEPGYHWVKGCDGEDTIVFWRGHGGDTHHENGDLKELDHWSKYPMWIAQEWTYLGPCLTPDEAAKREDAKWHEGYAVGVLDVRRGTAFGEPDTHYAALQKRVAELEEKLDAAGRVLHKAGEQFSEYATQFAAHKTAVSDLKAAANNEWAERCFSAYWRAIEGEKDE